MANPLLEDEDKAEHEIIPNIRPNYIEYTEVINLIETAKVLNAPAFSIPIAQIKTSDKLEYRYAYNRLVQWISLYNRIKIAYIEKARSK